MFNTKTGYVIKDRYWELPECNYKYESEDDLLNTLENLLRDSVNKQMVADVPVGVLLSGGIDSSIITALASNISRKVKTFTVGFPGYGTFDETKYAKIVSNYYNTEHIELKASNPDLEILMPKLAEQFDEPISDSSMIPTYLVSQLVREHCTVALGGDGGDELFGGYKDYNFYLSAEATFGKVPLFIRNSAKKIIENFVPLGFKGRNYLLQFCKDFQNFELVNLSLFDYQTRCKILSDFIGKSCSLKSYEGDRIHKSKNEKDLLQQLTRMDFLNYLPNNVLVKVDRSSMLSSLEVRAPFLDYRLIDFAFSSVPSVLKANKIDRKILLRKFSSKLMPADFDNRRKQGFSLPLDSLFREKKNNSFIKDVLFSKDCIIDKKLSGSLLNGLNYSRSNSDRIFNLVMFELWRKKYNINV
jgi:asparagine synthase (glutamine-hydrolysing)